MPVQICPRCKHFNPEYAAYCYFDGVVLQAQQNTGVLGLPSEFAFPSGRRCKTFDELAQGCQEEWSAARDFLVRGVFAQFFRVGNRAELARAAEDARANSNPDIGLTMFLSALPGARTQTPKLDLSPRRILLGKLLVGETKTVPLTITNQAQGLLQGTVTVSEGQDWLTLGDKPGINQTDVKGAREQIVKLSIHTKGQAAGQTYAARLTVVTNGGVVEVPLRMDLVPQPYTKAPFQGVRSQREMAERMRSQPKAAVPVLESGDVQRWFALNGWNYPVQGTPIKGVGGVQQFFEGMGVSKPPAVQLSKAELRLTCKFKETTRAQVTLQTPAKKWVYAQLSSDSPWLKLPQTQVSGPQNAPVSVEIDTNLWNQGPLGEGKVTLVANGGVKLTLKVVVEVPGAPAATRPIAPQPAAPPPPTPAPAPPRTPAPAPSAPRAPVPTPAPAPPMPRTPAPTPAPPPQPAIIPTAPLAPPVVSSSKSGGFIPALMTTVLLCLVVRVALVPIVDFWGRPSVVHAAAVKLQVEPTSDSPVAGAGGWLKLPWLKIMTGTEPTLPAKDFQSGNNAEVNAAEFRHYFASYFIRWFVLWTGWLGAVVGALVMLRRGGVLDIVWGIVAGLFAGLAASATFAAFFLFAELLPLMLWQMSMGSQAGVGSLLIWAFLAIVCWILLGIVLGFVLPLVAPLRRMLVEPGQALLARGFHLVGLKTLADYWSVG